MDDGFHANLEALVTKRKAFLIARQREPIDDLFRQNEEMFVFLHKLINDSVLELKSMIVNSTENRVVPRNMHTDSQFLSVQSSAGTTPQKVLVPETPPEKIVRARTEGHAASHCRTGGSASSSPSPESKLNTLNLSKEKLAREELETIDLSKPVPLAKRKLTKEKAEQRAKETDLPLCKQTAQVSEESFASDEPLKNEAADEVADSESSSDMMTQPPASVVPGRKPFCKPSTHLQVPISSAPSAPPRKAIPLQNHLILESIPSHAPPTVPSIPIVAKLEPILEHSQQRQPNTEQNIKKNVTSSMKKSRANPVLPPPSNISKDVGEVTHEKRDLKYNITQPPPSPIAGDPRTPNLQLKKKKISDENSTCRNSGSKSGSTSRNTFGSGSSSQMRKRRKRKRPRVSLEELEPEPLLETCRDDNDDDDDDFQQNPRPGWKTQVRLNNASTTKTPRNAIQTALKFKTGPSPTGLRFEGFKTPEAVDRAVRRQAAERRRVEKGVSAKETVLGHARKALQGYDCRECAEMFEYEAGGDPIRKQQLLKHCKHKAKKPPPKTPDDYWKLTFDETQTQAPATHR